MKHTKHLFIIVIAVIFYSCNVFKKSNETTQALPVINLDTIEKVAKTPQTQIYQASATRFTDIIHTKLDVSFDFTKQFMYGKATITAKPYFYPTSSVVLDARGMEIKEVDLVYNDIQRKDYVKQDSKRKYEPAEEKVVVKKPLKYTYSNDILTIQLDKEYRNTEQYNVYVDYISKPNELKKGGGSAAITDDKGLYFINPEGKEKDIPTEIWTQGETQSNSAWFPTIDRPNERMTQEIFITVDKKFVTLSNGELVSSSDNGDNTRTDYWRMDLPHAPYLAMMAIGEFSIVKDNWRDKEVNYYVEKEYEPYAKAIFGATPDMIEFFSNRLGVPFAWNKYSQVVVRDYVSGSMENTSATLHGEFMNRTDRELIDRNNEEYISHELFHQWFGDLVTCESWSNLPLNESFATYGEYLWEEHKRGRDAADYLDARSREKYLNEAQQKQVPLIRFQYDDREEMFDGHSYDKGGQVLHMLRKYVGDDAFFASLKLYLETNKFNSVEIHNLRLAFEQVTGEDLNWFFNQWFLSSGHPDIIVHSNYDETNKKEMVEIKQVQDFSKTPLFMLPIYVDIYANGKVKRERITVTKADDIFEFDTDTKPDLVNVDAEKQLLCTKNESKSITEWAFQYKYAPLYLDRYEALTQCIKNINDSICASTVLLALNDSFWGLRQDAIEALKEIPAGHEKEIKEKLVNLAKTDTKSDVRAIAIECLSIKYTDKDLEIIYADALKDKSYYVLGSALYAYSKVNPEEAMPLAKQYENEKSVEVLRAIAGLYADYGDDENNEFFIKSERKFKGFSAIGFIGDYTSFLKNGKKDETVNVGVDLLANIIKDENTIKWVAYYAKKSILDLASMYKTKVKTLTEELNNLNSDGINPFSKELKYQINVAKAQYQKLSEIFDRLK